MDWNEHPLLYKVIWLIPILLLINVLILDALFVINILNNKRGEQLIIAQTSPNVIIPTTPTPLPTQPPNPLCSNACLDIIRIATSSSKPTTVPPPTPVEQTSKVKEFYIPLGSSSFNSVNEWVDIPGIQANIDSGSFGKIKKVVFEVSLHVPNANEDVWVRLYNATDKHPVWFSELFFPSGTANNFQVSSPIALDPGIKLYKAQMKTQFKLNANLDQSRIHITTE